MLANSRLNTGDRNWNKNQRKAKPASARRGFCMSRTGTETLLPRCPHFNDVQRRHAMISLNKTILGAAVAACALAGFFSGASAAVACNGNICWHAHENYIYPPGTHVVVHPDDWQW